MTAAEMSAAALAAVLADMAGLAGDHGRGLVVDSPPGAGKSALVVRAATELAAAGEPVMVVAQTNGQVDDLADRLALAVPELPIGRLSAQDYRLAPQGARQGSVSVAHHVHDPAGGLAVV